jgi:N-methylhydantoinase A
VLVPEAPGVLCALGLLVTDLRADYSETRVLPLVEASMHEFAAAFAALEERANQWFEAEQIAVDRRRSRHSIDMRYAGQNYELSVPVERTRMRPDATAELRAAFARVHEQAFGYSAAEEPVQAVTFRIEAVGLTKRASLEQSQTRVADPCPPARDHRSVYMPEVGGWIDCPVHDRGALAFGHRFQGPAIVEQMDSTTLVLPGDVVEIDAYRNLILHSPLAARV